MGAVLIGSIRYLSMVDFVAKSAAASPLGQDRITDLHNSFIDFPALSFGAYIRMLYCSAVTQTTLGYGDVVPISDRTRFAVGLQSVLGIVMIGLLLNSLGWLRRERTGLNVVALLTLGRPLVKEHVLDMMARSFHE